MPDVRGLEILGCSVALAAREPELIEAIEQVYGETRSLRRPPQLSYSLNRLEKPAGGFSLQRAGTEPRVETGLGGLLRSLDSDLTVELQKLRRDLLFLHSGVISWAGRAVVLAGESGSGKSTTCWALSHFGAKLMSDELAPIAVEDRMVFPYPRALVLKREPPPDFPLPEEILRIGSFLHVPRRLFPGGVRAEPVRPSAVVFLLASSGGEGAPVLREVGAGETAARLYSCALNPLAHPSEGLDAVAALSQAVPGFLLERGDLRAMCELLRREFGVSSGRTQG